MKHFNSTALLAVLLFIVSCKSDPKPEQVEFKRTGNSVVVHLEADIKLLNPVLASSSYEMQLINQIYSYLGSYDADGYTLNPELVKEIPTLNIIDDSSKPSGFAYTFEMLEEAVWPNGDPVTGYDYEFMMKAIFNPLVDAIRYRAVLSDFVAGIEVDADNPKKFTVYIKEKSNIAMGYLTNTLPIIPAYVSDQEGALADIELSDLLDPDKADAMVASNTVLQEFAQRFNSTEFQKQLGNIVGSGPYSVVDWVDGQRITLQRKIDWWGDKISKETHPILQAYPDELIYKPITDPNTALAALRSEEIDVMARIPATEFEAMQEDSITGPRYDLEAVRSFSVYFISINSDIPKLSDKRVRKAFAYALDMDEILEKVYLGYGERTNSPVHPMQPYYNNDLENIQQNLEKARALLTEAGWVDSNNDGIVDKEIEGERVELSIDYMSTGRETSKNTALVFQDQAKQVGIDLQVNVLPASNYISNWRSKEYEVIAAGSSITEVWNPKQSWHTEGDNRTGFGNQETDALIDQIILAIDETERNRLYKELQAIIAEEQAMIYLFNPKTLVAVHERFEWTPTRFFPCFDPRFFKLKDSFK